MKYWTAEELRDWAEGLAGAIEQGARVVSVDLRHARLGSDDYTFRVEFTEAAWEALKVARSEAMEERLTEVKERLDQATIAQLAELDEAFELAKKEIEG
jgi:hypothetical protein